MSRRFVDQTARYQLRRAARHRHPAATAAADKLRREHVAQMAATASNPVTRTLAAIALNRLPEPELSSERQALLRRLGGQDK